MAPYRQCSYGGSDSNGPAREKLRSSNGGLPNRRGDSDRKSTRPNSSHTEIYTLSLHDALPIYGSVSAVLIWRFRLERSGARETEIIERRSPESSGRFRSEEHTSELQSHQDLHSFPTRRSSDLWLRIGSAHMAVPTRTVRRARN